MKKIKESEVLKSLVIDPIEVRKVAQLTPIDIVVYWLDGMKQVFHFNKAVKLI